MDTKETNVDPSEKASQIEPVPSELTAFIYSLLATFLLSVLTVSSLVAPAADEAINEPANNTSNIDAVWTERAKKLFMR